MANTKRFISTLIFLMVCTINMTNCRSFGYSSSMSPAPSPSPLLVDPNRSRPDDWSSSSPSPSLDYSVPTPATPSYSPSPHSPTYPSAPSTPAISVSPAHHGTPAYPGIPMSPYYPAVPTPSEAIPEAPPAYPPIASPIAALPPYPSSTPPPPPASNPPAASPIAAPPPYPSSTPPASNSSAASPVSAPPPYPLSTSPQPAASNSPTASPIAAPPPYPTSTPAPAVRVYEGIKAAYWPSFNGLNASAIDTTYFTHIYYAFLLLDPVTYKLNVTPFDQEKIPEFINTLRTGNPPVKTLLSIGGADVNQTKYFSIMSSSKETREGFINSTIEVARNYGFDGLDLDWESPANDQEMLNLALLLSEWRNYLDQEAIITGKPRLLLSAAVYYSSSFTGYGEPRSYPAEAINDFLDWINPMCYDYNGAWANFTGPNSALFDPSGNLSTSYGVGSWIESGVLPIKIVMGLPLYGPTWTLQDPSVNGIGARAVGKGPGDGILTYSQIIEFNSNNKGVVHFDGETVSYYSVSGVSWIGYDDTVSVDRKVQFARSRGLGGYFFWALGMDYDWALSRQASNTWDRN